MRLAVLLASALVAGCTLATSPAPESPAPRGLTPDGEGLQPAGTDLRIDFGRAQDGVIDAVTRLLGQPPADITRNPECGAGLVTAAYWPNGLTLNFTQGDFTGWVVTEPGLATAGGLAVGQLPPAIAMEETSLGREFERNGVWALVEDGSPEISTLWSGTTCFFR